jgi:hypothetical protein
MRKVMVAGFLAFAYVLPESAGTPELEQEITEAFNQYVRIAEDRMTDRMREGRTFLWVDTFPELQRDKLYAQLRQGNMVIEQLETLKNEKRIRVPNGLIHHCIALGFVPGVTLRQVLALMQDYDHHEGIYKPILLAWVVNPLLKSIPREYLSRLLISTRAALTNKSSAASFGTSPSMKQLSTQFFLVAPSSAAVQNEGHSTVILPIQERTICAPQKS